MKEKKEYPDSKSSIDQPNKGSISEKRNFNRREFIKTMGLVVAGTGSAGLIGACDGGTWKDESTDVALGVFPLTVPEAPIGNTTVSIVGGGTGNIGANKIHEMVSRAMALAGGLDTISRGQTVLIKPNISAGLKSVCTNPEVIRGIILEVKKRTVASNITVAERSSMGMPTRPTARTIGLLRVLREEGVRFVAWDDTPYVECTYAGWKHIKYNLRIPKSLIDGTYDHYINVPILKNHEMVTGANVDFTCCLKLNVGVIHPDCRMNDNHPSIGEGIHTSDLGEKVAELNLTVPYHTMNVVDALTPVLTNGPVLGLTANAGLVLASQDRVACDSLAVAVLRYYAKRNDVERPYVNKSVWRQASIVRAQELNLGRGPGNIDIADENVANISGILDNWS